MVNYGALPLNKDYGSESAKTEDFSSGTVLGTVGSDCTQKNAALLCGTVQIYMCCFQRVQPLKVSLSLL